MGSGRSMPRDEAEECRAIVRKCIATASAAVVLLAAPAAADPVAEFYRGRTVAVVSAGEAGGAHGAYTQLIAAHMRKHIPGNPTVIIQYMVGAGGNLAPNYLFSVAPKDGTAVGVPLQDLIVNARLGIAAVKYDPAKVHYLGGADTTRTTVTVMKASGIANLEDAKKREVLIGSSGRSGSNFMVPVALNAVMATRFKIVLGYPGINAIHLAMDRGEIHGTAASWPAIAATRPNWVSQGLINSLVTVALEREPDLPHVPALSEMVKAPDDLALISLMTMPAALGRAWAAFGDIPADRLTALRAAYASTLADPELKAEAAKRSLTINPVSWQSQQELASRILATSDATVARLKRIMEAD